MRRKSVLFISGISLLVGILTFSTIFAVTTLRSSRPEATEGKVQAQLNQPEGVWPRNSSTKIDSKSSLNESDAVDSHSFTLKTNSWTDSTTQSLVNRRVETTRVNGTANLQMLSNTTKETATKASEATTVLLPIAISLPTETSILVQTLMAARNATLSINISMKTRTGSAEITKPTTVFTEAHDSNSASLRLTSTSELSSNVPAPAQLSRMVHLKHETAGRLLRQICNFLKENFGICLYDIHSRGYLKKCSSFHITQRARNCLLCRLVNFCKDNSPPF
ncbi:uncharacterized protein LOC143460036 [Clavelina lepadiformis]|uniref:uncharacterized protein LOC143460036 n=1 Tax=Clavelina lepadiformis TaxID=159417 RepID=UPI004040EE7B